MTRKFSLVDFLDQVSLVCIRNTMYREKQWIY